MPLISASEIPSFTGDLGRLETIARRLAVDGEAVLSTGESLHATFQGIGADYQAVEVADLLATTLPVRAAGERLRDGVTAVSTALRDYTFSAQDISTRLEALRERARTVSTCSPGDTDEDGRASESNAIRAEAARLVSAFERMEADTVRTIESALPLGTPHRPVHGPYAPGREPYPLFPWAPELPAFGTPEEAAAWWGRLSATEQARLIELAPAAVGAIDGLPAAARDEANRLAFSRMWNRDRPDRELEWLLANEPERYRHEPYRRDYFNFQVTELEEWRTWDERRRELEVLVTLNDRLSGTGKYSDPSLPPAYLLRYEPQGRGRVVIANGDPDTASHTAVFVPGTGTGLADVGPNLDRMVRVWQKSTDLADGESVATVTWIGYEAPPEIVPDATSRSFAQQGAPELNSFLDGLDASRTSERDRNTTVIAHSYGSTLVGAATQERDAAISADNIIAVGSPGMLVGSAEELGIGAENIWSMQAPWYRDPVPDAGRHFLGESGGGWRSRVPGVLGFAADRPLTPSDAEFGAGHMTNDAPDHGTYWESEINLENQANVVIGKPGDVITSP
ncbi:alpha/beta hydrolase [Streptomyces otsuchiensis]|uniref:alpha/beta hydrolase n=1 Tax=Streptomyces otsuchiensis TaxID=2681388 RepID=UPI00102F34DF|nr:alpha/beta hydrolase [Streptomyces otsuchiensis]